jgi:C1A family cysteine protease/Leucine-rich repeat (LRR) protein
VKRLGWWIVWSALVVASLSVASFPLDAQAGPVTGLDHVPFKVKPTFSRLVKSTSVQAFPAQFDLRSLGRLSPVRDQGQLGTCWSFAVYGSLESNVTAYGKTIEFSEQNLKNNSGFAGDPNGGGNHLMAMAYMARWSGPVPENLDPYVDDPKKNKSPVLPPPLLPIKIQAVDLLPPRDLPTLKRYLMEYGAVYTSILVGNTDRDMDRIYNPAKAALFNPQEEGAGHAVTIVGWDDRYPKANFRKVGGVGPQNDGAFIVRNSWGTSWGDHGYFYISYEDANVATDLAGFVADGENRYNQIYQYDSHGANSRLSFDDAETPYAVKFTAQGNEDLAAIGLFTAEESVGYKISVGPTLAQAAHAAPVAEGSLRFPGYHVLSLAQSYPLAPGKAFFVVVRQTLPSGFSSVPLEEPQEGYVKPFKPAKGVFFYAYGDGEFQPLEGAQATANIALKAITASRTAADVKVSRVKFDVPAATLTAGETRKFAVTVFPQDAANPQVTFSVQPAGVARVDAQGNVTALSAGTAEVKALSADRSVTATLTLTVVAAPAVPAAVFGDPAVEQAVRKALNVTDKALSADDLARVKALTLSGKAGTLGGLELLPFLASLDLEGLQAKDLSVVGSLKALTTLSLAGLTAAQLKTVKLPPSLQTLDLSRTNLSSGWDVLSTAPRLTSLTAVQASVKDVKALAALAGLKALDLRNNKIASVAPLAALGQLTSLYLTGNPAADLASLSAMAPRLKSKDFDTRTSAVAFADQRIEAAVRDELGLADDEALTPLLLSQVEVLDLSEVKDHSPVNLGGLENLTNLYELYLPDLGIADASKVAKLTNLEALDLSGNQLTDLTFAKPLKNLTYLEVSDNHLTNLAPLAGLSNLEELYLAGNRVTDLRPLAKLTHLVDLDAAENALTSVDTVLKLRDLEVLDVSSNQLASMAVLAQMTWLDSLYVRNNPADDVDQLVPLLDSLGDSDFDEDGATFDPSETPSDEDDDTDVAS